VVILKLSLLSLSITKLTSLLVSPPATTPNELSLLVPLTDVNLTLVVPLSVTTPIE